MSITFGCEGCERRKAYMKSHKVYFLVGAAIPLGMAAIGVAYLYLRNKHEIQS